VSIIPSIPMGYGLDVLTDSITNNYLIDFSSFSKINSYGASFA